MTQGLAVDPDRRVLIHLLTRKDAEITQALLSADGVPSLVCPSFDDLMQAIDGGAAAILVAEERIAATARSSLARALETQPPWSDLPILVLTRPGADSSAVADAVRTLGNVTLLERPMRVSALTSVVRTAVRARERQYQIRGHVADRIHAEASLRDADRRKDEFLATLGHELRNPLAPILTSMQLLKLSTFSDARSARACTVIERQVNHLVRLVDDLLEVSRITRGIVDVRKEPLDLAAVLRTAIETSRPLIEAAHQELSVQLPVEPVPIAGDPVRLTQVFANLLNNASKYTEAGGAIWLSASDAGGWAIVSVRDNGIGIPPTHLHRVFDMFTQVDRSDRRAQGGLGIGLTLVRSLLQLHGGSVEARSGGTETGSEFVVRLPVAADRPKPRGEPSAPRAYPAFRIMIVDDNREAAESLSLLLSALGAIVAVAFGGHDALDALDGFAPDVMLVDLGMPGMDGFEVCRRIRSAASLPQVLLIALTGWGQEEDRERSRSAGFDHHLVKPLNVDRLRSLIAEHASQAGLSPRRAL
jgi:signal transduction histidine kinase/CheY-like chemotaxis protein